MKSYELTYIISSKLSELEAKRFSEEITELIKKDGGLVLEETSPTKKRLAYQIKKESEGFMVSMDFHFSPEKLKNLIEKIKSEDKILRSIIFTKKQLKRIEIPKIQKIKKEKRVALDDIEKKLEEILSE